MTLDYRNSWGALVAKWFREGKSAKRIARKTGLPLAKVESWIRQYVTPGGHDSQEPGKP